MNEQPTFTITLSWSEEEGAYIGQAEDLVGVAGSGSTYEEALASVLEAIRWRQERNGEEEPSPFSQMLLEDTSESEEGEEPPQAR